MTEQEKEEFSFIKEKIKEKPVNKKRLLRHGIYTVGFAVLFGVVACFVFTFLRPKMEEWLYPKEDGKITFPEDELVMETEQPATEQLLEKETQATEETEEETEQGTQTQANAVRELEISDYQMLQNKIYAVGKEANRSVVTVTGVTSDTDWYNNVYESNGQASGVIIGNNGSELLILTEHNVVQEAEQIHVTFINDVTVDAALKKYDGNTGIAILTVGLNLIDESTKNELTYASLGNSLAVSQGNIVIAIGSPLGTNYSVGIGNITSVGNVIQTVDAAYTVFTTDIVGNSNSNGVLLNMEGEIVGLVMQGYGGGGENATLTAVSISELKKLIEMLSNGMDIPYLGIMAVTVTDQISEAYDLPQGIYIKEVLLDSPAFEAGLQSGDVIVEMNGEAIYSIEAYESKLLELTPGEEVEIAVSRQGMDEYLSVKYSVTAGKL